MSKNVFSRKRLTEIVKSDLPDEAKVTELISLHEQDLIEMLNRLSNNIGTVIDDAKVKANPFGDYK